MNKPHRTNGLDARQPPSPEVRQKLRAFAKRWQDDTERLKQIASWRPVHLCGLEPSYLPQWIVEQYTYHSLLKHAVQHSRALTDIAAQLINFGYRLRFEPIRFERFRQIRLNSTTRTQLYRAFAQYSYHWQSFQTLFNIGCRVYNDIAPTEGMRLYKQWQDDTVVLRMNANCWGYLTAEWTVPVTVAPDLFRSVTPKEKLDQNEVDDDDIDGTVWVSIKQDPTQSLIDVRKRAFKELRRYRSGGHSVAGEDKKYHWVAHQPLLDCESQQPTIEDLEIGKFIDREWLEATIRAAKLKGQNAEMAEILRNSPELADEYGANIEIARIMNIPPGQVGVVKKRTIDALRKAAEKQL